jgi:hypothetical protein
MQEEKENICSLYSTSCDTGTVPLLNINLYAETILTEACLAETKANHGIMSTSEQPSFCSAV